MSLAYGGRARGRASALLGHWKGGFEAGQGAKNDPFRGIEEAEREPLSPFFSGACFNGPGLHPGLLRDLAKVLN